MYPHLHSAQHRLLLLDVWPPPTRHPHLQFLGDKLFISITFCTEQLGLDSDTRNIHIIYPLPKRNNLLNCINEVWIITSRYTQRKIATLLGRLQTPSVILPLGVYSSIHLQQWVNSCLAAIVDALPSNTTSIYDHTRIWRSDR